MLSACSNLAPSTKGRILYDIARPLGSEAESLAHLETSLCDKSLGSSMNDVEASTGFDAGLADKFATETIPLRRNVNPSIGDPVDCSADRYVVDHTRWSITR